MAYLQSSLNFSEFIRSEIRLGVGQAAIDMSFQTSAQFPSTFIINRIVVKVPLDVYTITLADLVNETELRDQSIPKEYSIEKPFLRSKFIDNNINTDAIDRILNQLDAQNRLVDLREFVRILLAEKLTKDSIVAFLRSSGISDSLITRSFGYGE